jgi:hypothetical protein
MSTHALKIIEKRDLVMGKLNMDKMQSKRDEISERMASNGDYEFYEIKKGAQNIRVLPPKGDNEEFWKEVQLHFNVGGAGSAPVACLKQFGHKTCPVCDEIARLKKSKSKEDQALSKKMRASNRVYVNILERDNKDKVDVVQIMNCGPTVLKCILDIICNPEYGDVTDFNEGFDLTLTKTGKGIDTEYSVLPKRNESKASEKLSEEELDEALIDYDTLVVEKTPEEIAAILAGEDEDDTVIDDEDNSGDNSGSETNDDDNNDETSSDSSASDDMEAEIERRIREEMEKQKKSKSKSKK